MNYKRNAKYFKATPGSPIKAIGFFVLVGWLAVFLNLPLQLVIVLGVIAVMYLLARLLGRPSDAAIDAQLDALAVGLKEEAMKQLGVDSEEVCIAPSLLLKGYSLGRSQLHNAGSGGFLTDRIVNAVRDVVGKDGYWRSPECVVTARFFTEDQILQYSKVVSLIAPTFKGRTNECAYKDVVSLRTETFERPAIDPKTGKVKKGKIAQSMAFAILNAGGEVLWCCSKDVEAARQSINAMRSLLRQKKMSS